MQMLKETGTPFRGEWSSIARQLANTLLRFKPQMIRGTISASAFASLKLGDEAGYLRGA